MSKRHKRKQKKKLKRRWYYDACALGYDRKTIDEIRSFKIKGEIEAVISYLALGEAYGKCCKKGEEIADTFTSLIKQLRNFDIRIIGNDVRDSLFNDVRKEFPALKIADAIHLATTIYNKCENLRTTDDDLYNLPRKKRLNFGKKYGISAFRITKID